MKTLVRLGLALGALSVSSAATAQTYTAQRITFSQPGTFTQQQLEDAAGLHVGSTLTADELAAAAQRLVNTGYFEDVGATIDGKITAVTVKFDTKPIDLAKMLHVGFENFVWLSHAELEAAIKAKFPLFCDYMPENSAQQTDISAALVAALAAKSIAAKVVADEFEPTLQHPLHEMAFRVASPAIRVANIKLAGVTPALVPLVQKSINATARTRYTEGPADLTTSDSILAPLLNAGYIQASLTGISLAPSSAPDGNVGVVVSATLQPGEIYHVSALKFAGTPMFPSDAFPAGAKLHAGDVASRSLLLESLAPIDAAYRHKGFLDVVVRAVPTFDSASQQVAYAVQVEPGEPYTIHEVTANNLDPAAKADFDRGFLLKPGEIYNPDYVATFLKKNTALQALAGYSAGFKAYADPNTHTVDLVITFVRAAR